MPQATPPQTPPGPGRDHTSLVVRAGLFVLLVLGVLTVFGEALTGALSGTQ
jgi:hypothetical protein